LNEKIKSKKKKKKRVHNLIGYYLEKNVHTLKIACFINTSFLSFSFTCLQGITLINI